MRARRDDHDPSAVATQRSGHARSHERRLAASRRPDHCHRTDRGEPAQTGRHVLVPPEEAVSVTDVIGDQAEVRTDRAGLGRSGGCGQRRILPQDRLLEVDEVGSRIQSQFNRQHGPGPVQGPQRIGLAARVVLRLREQGPAPFAQRRLRHLSLGGSQHLMMPTGAEGGVQAELLGLEPQLVEPDGLDPARFPSVEVDQRPSPPQRQRLTRSTRTENRPVTVDAQRSQHRNPAHGGSVARSLIPVNGTDTRLIPDRQSSEPARRDDGSNTHGAEHDRPSNMRC
jgi:hypothetical protein